MINDYSILSILHARMVHSFTSLFIKRGIKIKECHAWKLSISSNCENGFYNDNQNFSVQIRILVYTNLYFIFFVMRTDIYTASRNILTYYID